jgi:aspartate aminotransferase
LTLSTHINKIGASPTMKIAQAAKELLLKGEDIIDLSVGEPDFPTPQNIKEAAIRAVENNFTKYTVNAGTIELRNAVAKKLKDDNGLNYSPNEIIVSAGAKQCVYNAVQAIVYSDDEVIIPAPYYVSYPPIVSMAHGQPVFINTTEETGFKITPQQLKDAITTKTKLLIICNPCNPTGIAYTKNELEELKEILEEGNFYILTDEIYEKIIYDDYKFTSIASLSHKIKNKTIVVNGHSKAYSMTGWRIGYAAGPENIIKTMAKVQSHCTANACSISQAAAVEALNGPQDSVEFMRKEFELRRNFFHSELSSIEGIACEKPQGAFYLFPNISFYFGKSSNTSKIENSFDLAMYLLNEAKVAVIPGSSFGAEGYTRLSYSTSMENLKEGVVRIKAALQKLK